MMKYCEKVTTYPTFPDPQWMFLCKCLKGLKDC